MPLARNAMRQESYSLGGPPRRKIGGNKN